MHNSMEVQAGDVIIVKYDKHPMRVEEVCPRRKYMFVWDGKNGYWCNTTLAISKIDVTAMQESEDDRSRS